MRKVLFAVLVFGLLVFALWPLSPYPPATLPVSNVAPGQEGFVRHLELGLLYERHGLLDEAQAEYGQAALAAQAEIVIAAQDGLRRVLAERQNPLLGMQAALRGFLYWIGENLLRWLVVGVLLVLAWQVVVRFPRKSGYQISPFVDATGDDLGKGLHLLLYRTLQEAKSALSDGRARPFAESRTVPLPGVASGLEIPPFSALSGEPDLLDRALAPLDSFSVGGVDLPLGRMLLTARGWTSLREHVITGSLHRHGETLMLHAEVRKVTSDQPVHVWELSANGDAQPAARVAALVRELAFRILFTLCPGLEARTWRSLQLFTEAVQEVRQYGVESLDRAPLLRAWEKLSQALVLDPGYTAARYLFGVVSLIVGRYQEARDAFREITEAGGPLVPEAAYGLGLAFYHEFQDWANDQAMKWFTKAMEALSARKRDERSLLLQALIHCGLASAYAQRVGQGERREQAEDPLALVEQHCRQALSLAGDREEIQAMVHNARGIAYLGMGKTDEATTELKAAICVCPAYPVPYVYLAQAYAEAQPDEAIRWLEQAVRWHPDYEYAHFRLGRLYQQRQQVQAAKEAYARAPGIPDACNSLGEILAREGEYEEALAWFHRTVELNRRHARAWRNLAWWTLEAGKRDEASLRQATEWARRALELDRGTPYEWLSHDVLGWVLLHRGRVEEAEQELLRSISAPGGETHIQNRYHLACLYHRQGNLEGARQALADALKLDERGYWRDQAVKRMQELRVRSPQEV